MAKANDMAPKMVPKVYPMELPEGAGLIQTTAEDCCVLMDEITEGGVRLHVLPSPAAVEHKLDLMYGPMGWGCRRYACGGTLYCSVGVFNPLTGDYLHKDAPAVGDYIVPGMDKSKAQDASAFVHAAAHWGVCQDVLALPQMAFDKTQVEIIPVPSDRDSTRIKGYRLRSALTVDKLSRLEDGSIVAVQLKDREGKKYVWQRT